MILNLIALICFVLGPSLVAADATAPSTVGEPVPVSVSQECRPDTSAVSACVWTGDCLVPGCKDQCIVNIGTTWSFPTLRDRYFSEESYLACPRIAYLYTLLFGDDTSRRRRLQAAEGRDLEALAAQLRAAAQHDTAADMLPLDWAERRGPSGGMLRAGRSTLSLDLFNDTGDADTPEGAGTSEEGAAVFTADGESNLPPIAAPPGSLDMPDVNTAGLVGNPCPTADMLDEKEVTMLSLGRIFTDIFAADERSESISADHASFGYILNEPNTYRLIAALLTDPDRLKEYMTTRCMSEVVQFPKSVAYTITIQSEHLEKLDDDRTQVQCVDNFGAYDRYEAGVWPMLDACRPPFGASPDCFPGLGWYMLSSGRCALAQAALFNISDSTPLLQIAANVDGVHTACLELTSQDECDKSTTPVLDTIRELHDSIPLVNVDALTFQPAAPEVPPVPPVLFTAPGGAVVTAEPAVVPGPGAAPRGLGALAPEPAGVPAGPIGDEGLGMVLTPAPPGGDGDAPGEGGEVAAPAPESAGASGRPVSTGSLLAAALAAGVLTQWGG